MIGLRSCNRFGKIVQVCWLPSRSCCTREPTRPQHHQSPLRTPSRLTIRSNFRFRRQASRLLTRAVCNFCPPGQGPSRLNSTANPALTLVANFPHCLQVQEIPSPSRPLDTKALLAYLPNTGTISEAVNFYFTFVFSPPYEPFIPLTGVDTALFFPGGARLILATRRLSSCGTPWQSSSTTTSPSCPSASSGRSISRPESSFQGGMASAIFPVKTLRAVPLFRPLFRVTVIVSALRRNSPERLFKCSLALRSESL